MIKMPMVVPNPNESKDDFISRFMSDELMIAEFPEEEQRRAVAESTWEDIETIPAVSVMTIGEARGHGEYIDRTTLNQAQDAFRKYVNGVKVKLIHDSEIDSIVGYVTNPRQEGNQLLADLHLFRASPQYRYLKTLINHISDTFGMSIHFKYGQPFQREGKSYTRISELLSVDLVDRPAANPDGLFSELAKPKTQKHNMEKEEIMELVENMLSEKLSAIEDQMKSFGEKFAEMEPKQEDGQSENGLSEEKFTAALEGLKSDFDKKLGEHVKSYAEKLGVKPGEPAPKEEDKEVTFSDIRKGYKEGGLSEAKALRKAISTHPELYRKAMSEGKI